jgi:hypothetical protein
LKWGFDNYECEKHDEEEKWMLLTLKRLKAVCMWEIGIENWRGRIKKIDSSYGIW